MPVYEYGKEFPFAAFITNLGKYNEGELVGEWVKFPTTYNALSTVFERIGIGEKDVFGSVYEEWFITDYDCYVDGLYDKLGEYADLDELNYFASKLNDMSQAEYDQFMAAVSMGEYTNSIADLINLCDNLDCYDFYPDISDDDDLGRYYIESLGTADIPEYLQNYIDYEAYGRDVRFEQGGEYTDTGYVLRRGSAFHEFYDGDRSNIPDQYIVMSSLDEDSGPEPQQPVTVPDHCLTETIIQTPRGRFRFTTLTKEQMEVVGYSAHHSSDEGRHIIMGNGTQAFAVKNHEAEAKQIAAEVDMLCRVYEKGYKELFRIADYQQQIIAARIISGETALFKTQLLNLQKPEETQSVVDRIDTFEKERSISTYMVYQLKKDDATIPLRFEPLYRLLSVGQTIDHNNYDLVYAGELTPADTLETIYRDLNINHPQDYRGHSMSVSDVVVLREKGHDSAYYCDSIGFAEIPEFLVPQPIERADIEIKAADNALVSEDLSGTGRQSSRIIKEEKPSIRARLADAKNAVSDKNTAVKYRGVKTEYDIESI